MQVNLLESTGTRRQAASRPAASCVSSLPATARAPAARRPARDRRARELSPGLGEAQAARAGRQNAPPPAHRQGGSQSVGGGPGGQRRLLHLEQGVDLGLQVGDLRVKPLNADLQVLRVLGLRVLIQHGCLLRARSLGHIVRTVGLRRRHAVEEHRHHDVQDNEGVDQNEGHEKDRYPERRQVSPVVLGIPRGTVRRLEVVENGPNASLRPGLARKDLEKSIQRRGEISVILRTVTFIAARACSRRRHRQHACFSVKASESVYSKNCVDRHHNQ
mmetsp:Transcript_31376/g.89543  ORF Transcript_31376/g.89543 Transcript_31376/m.89543 type:complete len:274 (+) Transcript_31376:50-871(+)